MAGRGFGKTRPVSEWVLGLARGKGLTAVRIALVAATAEEARAILVEGPSGIVACAQPTDIREWAPARRTLRFANGVQASLYSGA